MGICTFGHANNVHIAVKFDPHLFTAVGAVRIDRKGQIPVL